MTFARYVIGVHIDKEPRVKCSKYYTPYELGIGRIKRFAVLGEDCTFEKWAKTFDGVTIELPIRIPHYAPETFVRCVEGKKQCGHTSEAYKLRPLATRIGARRALILVFSTAAWSNNQYNRYVESYVNYIVRNLRELLFVF